MNPPIDTSTFQLGPAPDEDAAEEGPLLAELADEALDYINAHTWAPELADLLLAFGVGGILGLFLARFAEDIQWHDQGDRELWVVTGDLPPAYFVTDDVPTPVEALEFYCELMDDWADTVLSGGDLARAFPVHANPTSEHAELLKSRIEFIREKLIPMASGSPPAMGKEAP